MRKRSHPSGSRLALAVAALALLPLAPSLHGQQLEQRPVPEEFDRLWFQELEPLLLERERAVFLSLESSSQRQAFRRAFLQARDPSPASFLNENKEALHYNVSASRRRGLPPTDLRSRLLVLHGPPINYFQHGNCDATAEELLDQSRGGQASRRMFGSDCLVAPPFELFDYGEKAAVGWAPVLFVTDVYAYPPRCQLYDVELRPPVRIQRFSPQSCQRSWYDLGQRFDEAKKAHWDWSTIVETGLRFPPQPDWLRQLTAPDLGQMLETAERQSRQNLRFTVAGLIPAPRSPETAVRQPALFDLRGALSVPAPDSWLEAGLPWFNLSYRADVFVSSTGDNDRPPADDAALMRVGHLDIERLVFRPESGEEPLQLPIEMRLPTGHYVVVVHVEDEAAALFATAAFDLEISKDRVNAPPGQASEPGLQASPTTSILSRPTVRLRPFDAVVVGTQPLEVEVDDSIARLDYLVDGELVASSSSSPFDAEFDFGPVPRERTLVARATDKHGRSTDTSLRLNSGLHSFDLQLENQQSPEGKTVVVGSVTVPLESGIETIEIYEGDALTATETVASFIYRPQVEVSGQRPAVVRAVARLTDGRSLERTVLLGGSASEEVDVELVEVFVKATTRRGQPILDLSADQLRVLEDGRPQTIQSFERVDDLAINLVLLLDTSRSMANDLERLTRSSVIFLDKVIQDDDRAALLTFNHRTYVAVPFTNDVEVLAAASRSLRTWGATTLFESTVLALSYLKGLEGKRALVVISDGVSTSTEDILGPLTAFAERTGVSVYTLGLGTQDALQEAPVAKRRLHQLARLTGGEYFRIHNDEALASAYQSIEQDLRSQYLLTYQAVGSSSNKTFRKIEVTTDRGGVELESRRGYYP